LIVFNPVRTTLTLEEDIAAELRRLHKARNEPFSRTVNAVLRAGLATLGAKRALRMPRYRTEPVSLGTPRPTSFDDLSEVLAFAERETRV
jgi:hypothetical protein